MSSLCPPPRVGLAGSPPRTSSPGCLVLGFGLDNGQESAARVTRVPSPSVGGFTAVFCVPQRSHRPSPNSSLSDSHKPFSLYPGVMAPPVCASLWMLHHLLCCLPKLCPHLFFLVFKKSFIYICIKNLITPLQV